MTGVRKIVIVEDAFVRSFLRAALERQGHQVICAMPAQATEMLKKGEVDLLVTNTPQTFADFGATVPLLYLAAFPDPAAAADFARWFSLRKPFQTTDLVVLVRQLLGTV